MLRRNPSNVLAAILLGDSFLARKEWKKAEQMYEAMIKQMPKSPVGYLKMGLSRKLQGKPDEAAGFFDQAVERNPKDLTAVNEYIFALVAAKEPEKAKKVLDETSRRSRRTRCCGTWWGGSSWRPGSRPRRRRRS